MTQKIKDFCVALKATPAWVFLRWVVIAVAVGFPPPLGQGWA